MIRVAMALAVGAALSIAGAAPAGAHSVSGVGADNYETTLEGVSPDTPGVDVAVIEGGSRLELTNTNDRAVVVLGYEDEPYLRIGPQGVFENLRSSATYLNRDRAGSQVAPTEADPDAEPDWAMVSDGQTARWHDHRIHWMGADVDRPDERFVVEDRWIVPLRFAGDRIEVTGQLLWVPGPSPLPWYALIVALVAVGAVVGLSARWARGLALLTATLIVVDVAHIVGLLGATADGPDLLGLGPELLYSIVAWVVGGAAVWLLWQRRRDGCFAALFAAVLLTVFGGLGDIGVLDHSQVPFAWSPTAARALVAATVGLGVGVSVGAVAAIARQGGLGLKVGGPAAPVASAP